MTVQRMCDPMLSELTREFQTDLGQVAGVISWFAVTYGVMQILYGPLADRIGKFRLVTFTTLGCSLGCIGCALAPTLGWLTFARMMTAAAAAAIIPVSLAWVGDQSTYDTRQETLARVGMGSTLGLLAGQFLGGLFTDTVGWRWGFVFIAMLFLLAGVMLWQNPDARAHTMHASGDDGTAPRVPAYRQALDVLAQPRPRWILLAVLIEGTAAFGAFTLLASHLQGSLGLSLSRSSAIAGLFGAGAVLFTLLAPFFIRRLGAYGLTRAGGAMFGLSFLVLAFLPWWGPAMAASLLSGLGFGMLHNTLQTHASEMAPRVRGISMSLFAGTLFAGQSLGVLAATRLVEALGLGGVIALGGGLIMGLGFLFPSLMNRYPARAV